MGARRSVNYASCDKCGLDCSKVNLRRDLWSRKDRVVGVLQDKLNDDVVCATSYILQ